MCDFDFFFFEEVKEKKNRRADFIKVLAINLENTVEDVAIIPGL